MATWSNVHDLINNGTAAYPADGYGFSSDDERYIYFLDDENLLTGLSGVNVWQLDTTDDRVVEVTDGSFDGSVAYFEQLICFKGSAYVVVSDFAPRHTIWVYEYTGSGTSWSLRLGPLTGGSFGHSVAVFKDNIREQLIVAIAYDDSDPLDLIRYTSDGLVWNTGSLSGLATPTSFTPTGYSGARADTISRPITVHTRPNPIYITHCDQVPFNRWNSGYIGGSYWVTDHRGGSRYHWSTNHSTRQNGIYSFEDGADPTGAWVQPTDSIKPALEEGFDYAGSDIGANGQDGNNWHQFLISTEAWTDSGEGLDSLRGLIKLVRLKNNGKIYALVSSIAASPKRRILGRSEALSPPGGGGGGPYDLTHSQQGLPGAII